MSSREVIWGGGEVFLYDLGRELTSRGVDVFWRVEEGSELSLRVPERSRVSRRTRSSYDLLVANDFRSFWQAVVLDGPRNKVFVGHGPWQFSPVRVRMLEVVGAKTFVVSKSVADYAVSKGMDRTPDVLPLGPGPSSGRFRTFDHQTAMECVRNIKFGCVARLDPIKRLPLFARVTKSLGASGIMVVPPPKSSEEAAVYHLLATSDHIELRVGGDPQLLWNDIDVFISTSKSESLGLAHLEALQSGVPVISTAVDGPSDFLTGSLRHGWLPGVEEAELASSINASLNAIQREWTSYWQDAERVLEARGIAKCADLIIGASV